MKIIVYSIASIITLSTHAQSMLKDVREENSKQLSFTANSAPNQFISTSNFLDAALNSLTP